MSARVVLAMSGGVDSSVAALLLKRQGYEVIGLFMRTGVHAHDDETPSHKKGCCSAVDAQDARRVADRLDMPFYALDFADDFGRIMDYFVEEYERGRTPESVRRMQHPAQVRQALVLWPAIERGLRGHGALRPESSRGRPGDGRGEKGRSGEGEGGPDSFLPSPLLPFSPSSYELRRAVDPDKDQSYVLFGLRASILPHLLFPVGAMHKEEVRDLARSAGLGVAEKPDSVEICFVPNNDHFDFIRRRRSPSRETPSGGNIVDRAGTVLAQHEGIEKFTIGQRKGLGFGSASRRYVLEIVPATREVIVGDREELLASGLSASRVNWLIEPPSQGVPLICQAKIRYRHQPAAATVFALPDGGATVRFEQPQSAIAPGQAVVFYDGDRVLGGGWIETSGQWSVASDQAVAEVRYSGPR